MYKPLTFGGSSLKLAIKGFADQMEAINLAAVRLASPRERGARHRPSPWASPSCKAGRARSGDVTPAAWHPRHPPRHRQAGPRASRYISLQP